MTTPTVPQELKAISPYLARANELAKPEPVISYWCTYYALQQAMSVRAQDPESQSFLLSLMDKLEETKAAHSSNEAITDDIAAAAYVENFGLKIFSQADNEDRKGKATRLTARKFLASANFLEVLSIFGETTPENREKIKYAKWKASDIAKAFREGRTPTPGPAGGLQEGDEDAVETSQVTSAEAKELSKELAELGTDDERRAQVEQGGENSAASTRSAASAGGSKRAAADDDEPASYPFPQQPTQAPSAPPADLDAPDFIDEEPSHAATLAVPSFLDTPVDDPASPAPPTPVPQTHQTANLPDPGAHQPSEPPAFPSAVFPSAPSLPAQPSAPSPPPAAPARPSAPSAAAATAPSRPLAPPAPVIEAKRDGFDPMTVAQVQKHAKWAISALNYDDFETARKELRLALAMLGG